jgi:hypothetical protein
LLVVFVITPVRVFVIVTSALGTTARVTSTTTPVSDASVDCAITGANAKRDNKRAKPTQNVGFPILGCSVAQFGLRVVRGK